MRKTYPINYKIKRRIKQTTEHETKLSRWITLAALVLTTFLAILVAYGLPTGTSWVDHTRNIVLAICFNSILFFLFSFLLSIILSYIKLHAPYRAVASLIYTGFVYGITLHYDKAGTNFAVLIGILIVSMTIFTGVFMYSFLSKQTGRKVIVAFFLFTTIISLWQKGIYWDKQTASQLLDNESENGSYEVDFFTYGSGQDLHRKEFAKNVTEITPTVDASDFITKWPDKRRDFWGFDPSNFPINGRAFMPEGEGPFPLILMVHGNHTMEHLSTAGYDYLGETLASQGFFFVSVDEDFVNYSNHTGQPNDNYRLRTWLLLQHLIHLDQMNNDPNSKLFNKLNMDAVALSGHSRGGQAAAMAADYERFFDDPALLQALEAINIRAVAAVSPTDRMIDDQRAYLDHVAYFSIHGAQDADVFNFRGDDQFYRTNVSNDESLFKATAYIETANHVQFNSDWGKYDLSLPKGIFLNQGDLMAAASQQQIAKVYLSAFYQAVFNETASFDQLITQKRNLDHILPDVRIIEKYHSSAHQTLLQFNTKVEASGQFDHFARKNILRPKNRSGGSHANDVLQLAWQGSATYSLPLAELALDNKINIEANKLILSLANRSRDDIHLQVIIKNEREKIIDKELVISPAIDIKQTRFGIFDTIFRDGKYEVSSEAIFETIALPLDELAINPWSDLMIDLHFSSEEGELFIEEIAVE